MSNNTNYEIEQDRDRIDVSEEHECLFWMKKFGVTYAVLKDAVVKVGPRATDVRKCLGK